MLLWFWNHMTGGPLVLKWVSKAAWRAANYAILFCKLMQFVIMLSLNEDTYIYMDSQLSHCMCILLLLSTEDLSMLAHQLESPFLRTATFFFSLKSSANFYGCAGQAAENSWAPLTPILDCRKAAADNLSAGHWGHAVLFNWGVAFLMLCMISLKIVVKHLSCTISASTRAEKFDVKKFLGFLK